MSVAPKFCRIPNQILVKSTYFRIEFQAYFKPIFNGHFASKVYWSLIRVTELSTQLHFALHNITDDTILCHRWYKTMNFMGNLPTDLPTDLAASTGKSRTAPASTSSKEVAQSSANSDGDIPTPWNAIQSQDEMWLSRLGYKQVSLVKNWSSYHWAELNSPLNISSLTISCHRFFSMLLLQEAKRIFGLLSNFGLAAIKINVLLVALHLQADQWR